MTRLREARGQTLVFFVVLMGGLILLLAFVLNVGEVANTQRQVQSLADGAALAGVQQLPFDQAGASTAAGQYGSCAPPNPNSCQITFPDTQTINVQVDRQVSGLLLPLVTTPTAHATASARIEAPPALNNTMLRSVSSPNPKPYLVPLVVSQSRACSIPSCFGTNARQSFNFGSGVGFMCPEGTCSLRGRGRNTLRNQLECRSCLNQTYASGDDENAASALAATAPQVGSALQSIAAQNQPVIVPVYSSSGFSDFGISGFAELVITGVRWDQQDNYEIDGYFETYTVPGHLADSENASTNYGVSVIGLTQ